MATPKERATLREAILSSIPEEPSQFDQVAPHFVYVPHAHIRALSPDAMLVEGIRGAGKSFWWHALRDDALRASLFEQRHESLSSVSVSTGFGQGSDPSWPDKDELQALLKLKCPPRLIWKSVVLRQIVPDLVPFSGWSGFAKWVQQEPSKVANAVRAKNDELRTAGRKHIVLFDALDNTADTWEDKQVLLRGLLELVLELRALYAIRAKVFVRPDMLKDSSVQAFTDASKVIASRVSLSWTPQDLFGLLFRYLANAEATESAEYFRRLAAGDWTLASSLVGWQIPSALRSDPSAQEQVFVAVAGPWMGRSRQRGKTYTWVPNHLADAFDQVSPRSFLAAIRAAAQVPEVAGQTHALHWTGLQEGVRRASEYRVIEIREDLPWAHEAMRQLEDIAVPCKIETMLHAWSKGGLLKKLSNSDLRVPRDKNFAIFKELQDVGILRPLSESRVNIPDVYRVGFGLRRKGGFVPR